jgi:hypothetical protein
MKQKIYILGLVTAIIAFTGTVFKLNHWPGAGILITIGLVTLILIFIPAALVNHYKTAGKRQNLLLYIITWLTCFVIFTSMLFKIMHWPGAGIMLTIALPFPYLIFLPVFLVTTSKNKNFSIYNTVFVLLLLAVNSIFAAFLALNVTKDRIVDSYDLSVNYNKVEAIMDKLPEAASQSAVNQKIDEVLKTVNTYQDLIFAYDGITEAEWNNNPDVLFLPDNRSMAAKALMESGEVPFGSGLQKGLQELLSLMEKSPDYEGSSSAIIDDMEKQGINEEYWPAIIFTDNHLAWVLIYLDGLETNLKILKSKEF